MMEIIFWMGLRNKKEKACILKLVVTWRTVIRKGVMDIKTNRNDARKMD